MTAWAVASAAVLGIDVHPGAVFWRLTPGEIARRLHARRTEAEARAADAWLRHANTLAFHASDDKKPVTAADVYPDLFGPSGRWPLPGGTAADRITARYLAALLAVEGPEAYEAEKAKLAGESDG